MKYPSFLFAAIVMVGATACGGNSGTGPSPSYENIAGTYSGGMTGISAGVALSATFSITLTQSSASIGGSYGLTGTVSDGVSSVDIAGTGTLVGTIVAGSNPSVNITVRSGDCPTRSSNFSGAYDSANSRLTITGPVQVFANDCTVFRTYQTTFILNR